MISAQHRIISASLWTLCTAAVSVFTFTDAVQPGTKPTPPDVTALQIYALPTLFGLAAITGIFFALGHHWAHIATRIFTTVFIIFIGFLLIVSLGEIPREDVTRAVVITSIATIAFLIGLYACIVSWRTPL